MPEIWADFNEQDEDGNVLTLERTAVVELYPGRSLLAGDSDGNVCKATVIDLTDGLVSLSVDWGSFDTVEAYGSLCAGN